MSPGGDASVRLAGAAVAAALALAVPAHAAPDRGGAQPQVTILARPLIVSMGQRLTLYGSVSTQKANEIVTIQVKECGSTWFRGVAAARTRAGGGWSIDYVNPGITAAVRAVWNGKESAPVTVRQRAWVTLRLLPGSSSRFEVIAWRHQRKRLLIQRFDGRIGTWTTFRSVVVGSDGSVEFTASVPKGTRLRAVLPLAQAKPCYLAGTSKVLRT